MFSFQARNEMLIVDEDQIQDLIFLQQGHDHHVGTVGVTSSYLIDKTDPARACRPPRSSTKDHNNIIIVQNGSKKMLHRDIERIRRQQMATLHASLRNLLPLQYIKGKRSTSEHIYEAAKYIKHLKNQVTELSGKRDKLRTLSAGISSIGRPESSSSLVLDCSVTVRPCSGGLQILSSSSFKEERLMTLSRMLRVISREKLSVVSCVSTKVGQRLLHTIYTEVCDLTSMDLSGLEKKILMEVFHNQD